MANKIQLKRSISSGQTPSAGQLVNVGELFVNTADGKIWLSKGDGTAHEFSAGGGGGGGITIGKVRSIISLRI